MVGLISDDRLMKKPALIKEKAKKNILQPSARKSSRTKAATAPVTVSAVVNDPVPVEDKRRKIRLGSVAGVCLLVFSVLYLLMLISYNQADPSFTHAAPNVAPKNWIGLLGAWVSDIALFALGWSAYWLFPVALMSAWRCLSPHYRKLSFGRIWHLFGLLILLCASTSLEALRLYYLAEPLPGQAGGVLGQSVMTACVPVVGALGLTLLMVVLAMSGAAIFFDFSWLDVTEKIGTRLDRIWHFFTDRHEAKVDQQQRKTAQEELAQQFKQDIPALKNSDDVIDVQPEPVLPAVSRPVINPQAKVKKSEVALEAQQDTLFEDASQPIRPSLRLFDPAGNTEPSIDKASLAVMSGLIESKLASYGVTVKVKAANPGPVVTRYEIELAEGVKSSSVKSLESDLARVLSVQSVRVLDTVPNTPYMGIEVPNPRRQLVRISELLGSQDFAKSKALLFRQTHYR